MEPEPVRRVEEPDSRRTRDKWTYDQGRRNDKWTYEETGTIGKRAGEVVVV